MCLVDDAEGRCEVYSLRHNTSARKEHRCSECFRTIKKGESYVSGFSVFQGDTQVHKACVHCAQVRQYLDVRCKGYIPGSVYEDISNHWFSGDKSNLVETRIPRLLSLGMKARWSRLDGSLWPVPGLSI